MSAVAWGAVGITAPSRPHSRLGVALVVVVMGSHKVAGQLNKYSRGGRSPTQKRHNPGTGEKKVHNLISESKRWFTLKSQRQ